MEDHRHWVDDREMTTQQDIEIVRDVVESAIAEAEWQLRWYWTCAGTARPATSRSNAVLSQKDLEKAKQALEALSRIEASTKWVPVSEQLPTLRDRFAMAALSGLLYKANADGHIGPEPERAARMASEYADEMMKARIEGG